MKYTILLLLGMINARMVLNSETEEALVDMEDGVEDDVEESNGLPYSSKSVKDAYLLQLDSLNTSGTNNSILIDA